MRPSALTLAVSLLCSIAHAGSGADRWQPASKTAMSITGPVTVSVGRLQFGDLGVIDLHNPKDVSFTDNVFGRIEARRATVEADQDLMGLRGNVLKRKGAAQVYVWWKGDDELALFICPNQDDASDSSIRSCDSYFYDRPGK